MPPPKQWPVRRDNGRDTPARWCIATANAARRSYRANVGHDLGNVDPYTNVPLAARVCYDVAGLQFSFQTDKFQDIVDYTDGNLGPLLSALCGFCWFVKVSNSLLKLASFFCTARVAWYSVCTSPCVGVYRL